MFDRPLAMHAFGVLIRTSYEMTSLGVAKCTSRGLLNLPR